MKIQIIAVGRPRRPLDRAIAEYEERAARYWKLDVVEVSAGRGDSPDRVMEAEAEAILSRVGKGLELVALTREGRQTRSTSLARWLGERGLRGHPGVAFVLGGAFGLSDAVIERSRRQLGLSTMTLPHELARLVLAEQLYRAGTILRNEPYHKGPGLR